MVAGNIADINFAESVVADGKADIVGMVRGLIADPRFLEKAFAGQEDRIVPALAAMNVTTAAPSSVRSIRRSDRRPHSKARLCGRVRRCW